VPDSLRQLDPQVPETPESLDSDQIARQRAAVAEGIEGGDAGAHQRRGLGDIEGLGHPRQGLDRRDHELLVAAVVADATDLEVRAGPEVAPPARRTGAVLPAVPADANALALLPRRHAGAHLIDDTVNLVSGHSCIVYAGDDASFRHDVAVSDT